MKRKKSLLRCVEPYLYLLPAVVLFVLFVYYPFLKNEVLSFFTLDKFRTVKGFAGIQNYVRVFGDEPVKTSHLQRPLHSSGFPQIPLLS